MLNQRRDSRYKRYHHNKVLAKRGCWAEPNRATRTTKDHPEVHQQRYHLKYRKYKLRVAGLPAAKGTFGSLGPQLFGDCSWFTIRPGVRCKPYCSPFPQDLRLGRLRSSVNKHPSVGQPRAKCCVIERRPRHRRIAQQGGGAPPSSGGARSIQGGRRTA